MWPFDEIPETQTNTKNGDEECAHFYETDTVVAAYVC
jgi:hypothetical protein